MSITKYEKKILKTLYREIIMIKYHGRCLKCGASQNLQVSHIESVGRWKKLEYDTDNAIILCLRDHLYWWHKDIRAANEWLETVISKTQLDRLKMRRLSTGKGMYDYKLIKIMLEQELKELLNK
jgi:hypothetical protein